MELAEKWLSKERNGRIHHGCTNQAIRTNEDVKILWDFKIQTNKHLAHNILDITVVEKKRVRIIDVAMPGDGRIEEKELEKISKYQDLKIEIERLGENKPL